MLAFDIGFYICWVTVRYVLLKGYSFDLWAIDAIDELLINLFFFLTPFLYVGALKDFIESMFWDYKN